MNKRQAALWVWERQLGLPYIWSGDNPLAGFDCSGLVVEGLQAVGILGPGEDRASFQLAEMYPDSPPRPGALLFWHRGLTIGHVEIVWRILNDGTILTIGASGGNRATSSRSLAEQADAYVKIRPAAPNWVQCVDPFAS